MTITTIGAMMVHDALPEDLRKDRVLDKNGLKKVLSEVGEKHTERYGEIIHTLKQIGNHAAYEAGTSFRLEDFAPNTHMRDSVLKEHKKELDALLKQHAANPHLQLKPSFANKKLEIYGKVEEKIKAELREHVKKNPNNLTDWYLSGSRGDEHAVRQINTMVGRQVDVTNSLVPEVAVRSFSEGLSPVDYLVHAAGARKGVVATYTSVQEPGAFAKTMFAASSDMVVSALDCGTKRGRTLTPGPDCVDRYLAEDVPGIGHRNDLVTMATVEAAKKKGIPTLKVRSPVYCQQHEGVCAYCYGLSESGRLPHVGEHVGIKAAQGLSEPLTQLALNNKHGGGTVKKKSPLLQITQFMNARKVTDGAAVLANASGTVTAVEQSAGGMGHDVWIDGVRHFIHTKSLGDPLVKVGDTVKHGQALSAGQANPAEIVKFHGMDHGREYFADQTRALYGENGIKGHAKVFETISRALLAHAQVHHAGDNPDLVPGQMVKWNSVAHLMEAPKVESVPIHKAEGRILANSVGKFNSFSMLTKREVKQLQNRFGDNHMVTVFHPDQPVIEPVMLGAEGAALHKGDWMANFGYSHIKGRLVEENAPTFAVADLHGFNPITSYAYGAEFGKGESGRY